MTEVQASTVRAAATRLSENSGMAAERIVNFAEDARAAIRSALHRTYPAVADSISQQERYSAVKNAAQVIEEFHGIKS